VRNIKFSFRLTEAQNKLLFEKEKASFIKHCKKNGISPKAFEVKLIESFRQRNDDMVESLCQGIDDQIEKSKIISEYNSVLRSKDYWQYMKWQTDAKREMISNWICKAAPSLPINYRYVSQIAQIMGLPEISERNSDSLISFIFNIPLMNVFNLEFNAFVTGDSVIEGIPCVCHHTSAPDLCEFFTNLFLSALLIKKNNGRMRFADKDVLNSRAS
jgi:hypothetical protein